MAVRKKYELIGHVFGSRYWSRPCISPEYIGACIDYVHHNPVEAGICEIPTQYRWSSAAFYGGGSTPCDVNIHPVPMPFTTSYLVGPFIDPTTQRPLRSLERVILSAIKECDVDVELDVLRGLRGKLATHIRAVCIRSAVQAGYRNCQIARYLCVGEATVSRIAVQARAALLAAGISG